MSSTWGPKDVLLKAASDAVSRFRGGRELSQELDVSLRDDERLLCEGEFRPGRLNGSVDDDAAVFGQQRGGFCGLLRGSSPTREESRERQLLAQSELVARERSGIEVEVTDRNVAGVVSNARVVQRTSGTHTVLGRFRYRNRDFQGRIRLPSTFEAPIEREWSRDTRGDVGSRASVTSLSEAFIGERLRRRQQEQSRDCQRASAAWIGIGLHAQFSRVLG